MARLQVHPQRLKLVLSDNAAPIIERLDQAVPVIQCEFSFVLQNLIISSGCGRLFVIIGPPFPKHIAGPVQMGRLTQQVQH